MTLVQEFKCNFSFYWSGSKVRSGWDISFEDISFEDISFEDISCKYISCEDISFEDTVKLGNKEWFDKEQIGIKEPFPLTNLPFTS